MKKIRIFFFAILTVCNMAAQSTDVAPAKLTDQWLLLLDSKLGNFDKFIGVPHFTITSLPDAPKGDGMNGTPLGLNNDPLNCFSTITENNELILKITGEIYGGLSTKDEYDNYHFSTLFKWGEKKYEPRLKDKRDNGILYHCSEPHGTFWNVWMNSIEMQVQEDDMGDLHALTSRRLYAPALKDVDSVWMFSPNAPLQAFGWSTPESKKNGRCKVPKHYEKPNGEWNLLELICLGDTSYHIVNGVVVNMVIEDSKTDAANYQYKRKGKLQFQCEAAESYYKDMKIKTITAIPENILKQVK